MKDATRRHRLCWLQQNKALKEPPVNDEELIKLCRSTDWNSPGARQLMRPIITLSRSGLRCVTACILTQETVGLGQNLHSRAIRRSRSECPVLRIRTCRSSISCWWPDRTSACASSRRCVISWTTCTLRPLVCRTARCSVRSATMANCWVPLRLLEMCGGRLGCLPPRFWDVL